MRAKKKFKTVDEYIESLPKDTKRTLLALRAIIREAVPDATELFNYDIPAYALVKGGKRDKQIMIAGYKNNQPLPENLIVEIIQFKKSLLTDSSKS
jgi:hypothetical protein